MYLAMRNKDTWYCKDTRKSNLDRSKSNASKIMNEHVNRFNQHLPVPLIHIKQMNILNAIKNDIFLHKNIFYPDILFQV